MGKKLSPKRVMILGSCGSGKTTLAKEIGSAIMLDVFHLDQYFWKPSWTLPDENEWKETVEQLANKDSWIIEGNYCKTADVRIEKSDLIVFIDTPTIVCLYRIIKRTVWNYGRVRPGMHANCYERWNIDFLISVYNFESTIKPILLRKICLLEAEKKLVTLKNEAEISSFLLKI